MEKLGTAWDGFPKGLQKWVGFFMNTSPLFRRRVGSPSRARVGFAAFMASVPSFLWPNTPRLGKTFYIGVNATGVSCVFVSSAPPG